MLDSLANSASIRFRFLEPPFGFRCTGDLKKKVKIMELKSAGPVSTLRAKNGVTDILLVEDNPLDAELTLLALRDAGFSNSVEHVIDGEEALDLIFEPRSAPTLPKLILLDLNLGKMGGLHVLRRLKSDERTKG